MGVDWTSPAALRAQQEAFAQFLLVMTGVASWEFLLHLPFDLAIILGRRRFRSPMILYFVCRISMVLHIWFFAWNFNATEEVPCQTLVWVTKITDCLGTVSSSAILVLRTYAVWGHDPRVGIALLLGTLGQFGLWLTTFAYSRSVWDPVHRLCAVHGTAPRPLLVAVFSYTMVFDVLILALAAWRLWPDRGRGGISGILLRDGLAYFAAACAANGAQAVVAARAPSPVLALLFLPPALVVSTLAAATVFRNIDAAGASTPRGPSTAASTTGGSLPRFARFKRPGDSERTTTRGDDEPGLRGVPRLSRAASRSHAEHIELDVLDVLDYEPGGKLPAIDERAALAAHPSPLSPRATLSSPPPSAYAGRERRLSYHMDPPALDAPHTDEW